MSIWAVDPLPVWLERNQGWLLEANLPETPRCEATLTAIQCELIAGHESEHMVHMAEKKEPEPVNL